MSRIGKTTRRLSYSHRLSRMYFNLLRRQRQGEDFSVMDQFIRDLRVLVAENAGQNLKKVA